MSDHGFVRLYRLDGESPDDGDPILFVAATAGLKGDRLDLGSGIPWDFSRGIAGEQGPRYPFLWVHDLAGRNLPLGVADVLTSVDELPMKVAVTFDPQDELAMRVRGKYLSPVGGLAGISVSWDDVGDDGVPVRATGKKVTARQLLEISAVPVGLDPDALKEGARTELVQHLRAVEAALGFLQAASATHGGERPTPDAQTGRLRDSEPEEKPMTDEEQSESETRDESGTRSDTDEDAWRTYAAAMVDVFDRASDDSDEKRRRSYNALLPTYRRLRKEPPEWLGGDELRALDEGNWRALFLAGELVMGSDGTRAGKVLSSRNEADITAGLDAISNGVKAIRAVLDRATGREPARPEKDDDEPPEGALALLVLSEWLDERLAEGQEETR